MAASCLGRSATCASPPAQPEQRLTTAVAVRLAPRIYVLNLVLRRWAGSQHLPPPADSQAIMILPYDPVPPVFLAIVTPLASLLAHSHPRGGLVLANEGAY